MPRVEPVWSLYVKLLLAMGLDLSAADADVRARAFRHGHGAAFLSRNFKYAVLIIFIIAAIVTPDASVVPQVIMAGSMIVLYILSIGVVWIFGKKSRDDDANG